LSEKPTENLCRCHNNVFNIRKETFTPLPANAAEKLRVAQHLEFAGLSQYKWRIKNRERIGDFYFFFILFRGFSMREPMRARVACAG
jgi:hypothetical protein